MITDPTITQHLRTGNHPLLCAKCCTCSAKHYIQDLRHARTIIWTPRVENILNSNTAQFFAAFKPYVTVQQFDYSSQVKGTVWETDPFFGNASLVRQSMPDDGSYTDVVRMLLLFNFGGESRHMLSGGLSSCMFISS